MRLRFIPFFIAMGLMAGGTTIVVVWLLSLVDAYEPESGLLPWNAAGVIMFGLPINAVAALVVVPGVLWGWSLSANVPNKWKRLLRAPIWLASVVLGIGFCAAVGALIREGVQTRQPPEAISLAWARVPLSAWTNGLVAVHVADAPRQTCLA